MPVATADSSEGTPSPPPQEPLTRLPFDPITQDHILNCSVHSWHPRYRTLTPKTRLVPLPQPFVDYLRADGIFLTPEGGETEESEDEDDSEPPEDPSIHWKETHNAVIDTIKELGGRVHPKLNWSAPKDATFMSSTKTMECMSPNEVYVLLKSSDFVTHDLEQAFYGCAPGPPVQIPFHLVLRKSIPSIITSMEFRCFVKKRKLIGICQRELYHYDFLPSLLPTLQDLIEDFFEDNLQDSFPDENFVFDVYIPQPKERGRVWLIDINPWAPRTDPLLFSWLELLTLEIPDPLPQQQGLDAEALEDGVVRLSLRPETTDTDSAGVEEMPFQPEFRIVKRDDPEAYSFSTALYSAHKLPREVVEAGMEGGGGMRDFIAQWRQQEEDARNGRLDDSDDDP